jgi:ABC-2 type transport system permease protein
MTTFTTFTSLVRLFLRLLATKGRLLALSGLTIAMLLLAVITGRSTYAPINDTWTLFRSFGLSGIIPISALVMGSSAFGDLVEDRTLVHLWLRPANRSLLVGAAWVAAVLVCIPFTVVAITVSLALAKMPSGAIVAGGLSSLLGTLAYSSVFLALGLKLRRALPWGLAYILIWEGVLANAGQGLARFALSLSTRSVSYRSFRDANESMDLKYAFATSTGVIVLVGATVVFLGLTLRWLKRADVA